jgi:Flp pilus assembly protein TadG
MKKAWSIWKRADQGSSIVETALILPVLLVMLVVAVDLGRAYYVAIEVTSAAHAGALYGAQFSNDTTGMIAAAKLDAPDVPSLQAVAIYGCECADGSGASSSCATLPASCSFNVVNYAEVDTTVSYVPILIYPGLRNPIPLSGKSIMRAAH